MCKTQKPRNTSILFPFLKLTTHVVARVRVESSYGSSRWPKQVAAHRSRRTENVVLILVVNDTTPICQQLQGFPSKGDIQYAVCCWTAAQEFATRLLELNFFSVRTTIIIHNDVVWRLETTVRSATESESRRVQVAGGSVLGRFGDAVREW